jgi:hypothetical protein
MQQITNSETSKNHLEDFTVRFVTFEEGIPQVFALYKKWELDESGNEYIRAWSRMGHIDHQMKTITLVSNYDVEILIFLLYVEIHGCLTEMQGAFEEDTLFRLTDMMNCQKFSSRLDFIETTSLFNGPMVPLRIDHAHSKPRTHYRMAVPRDFLRAINWHPKVHKFRRDWLAFETPYDVGWAPATRGFEYIKYVPIAFDRTNKEFVFTVPQNVQEIHFFNSLRTEFTRKRNWYPSGEPIFYYSKFVDQINQIYDIRNFAVWFKDLGFKNAERALKRNLRNSIIVRAALIENIALVRGFIYPMSLLRTVEWILYGDRRFIKGWLSLDTKTLASTPLPGSSMTITHFPLKVLRRPEIEDALRGIMSRFPTSSSFCVGMNGQETCVDISPRGMFTLTIPFETNFRRVLEYLDRALAALLNIYYKKIEIDD